MDSDVSVRPRSGQADPTSSVIIEARAGAASGLLLAIAFIWNVSSIPATYLFYVQFVQQGQFKAVAILLIPLIGFLLTSWIVHARRAWRLIGPVSLRLDPFPGAIGGHIGGWIDIPKHFNPDACVIVTLSCLQTSQFGQDHQLRVQETVRWQEQGLAYVAKEAGVMRLLFRFRVPPTLPESDQNTEPATVWRLHVSGELDRGVHMDRDFEIPVFRTAETSSRQSFTNTAKARGEWVLHKRSLANLMTVDEQDNGDINIDYAYGRSRASALLYTVVGCCLLLAALTMLWLAPVLVKYLVLSVGVGCIVWAIYLLGNRLCVTISADGITTRRYCLGLILRSRQLPADRFAGFAAKPMNGLTFSRQLISQYRLYAINDAAEQIAIAENLHGRGQLHAIEHWFISKLPFEAISQSDG